MKQIMLGYNAVGAPVQLTAAERSAHMHIIGSSGSGKSKFLEWLMRGDIQRRQGFCLIDPHGTLYDAVLNYCAHHVSNREIIPLNLSQPNHVVSFNPFQRSGADIAVQVDRRIQATMHAWNVPSTDQTPTLERTLRLIYTVMLEQNISLPQIQHLIDWQAGAIRGHLIEQLASPLIRSEWQELHKLTRREWREEILSAKNRLFRFLTSPMLCRFMGLPGRTINLQAVMERGAILLVNLAPSDYLSEENGRVFGALLVNEFFEAARRRTATTAQGIAPYFLYIDEFQNFVSLDMADMLDQLRKFGLFLTLAHQRFGQIDENITDAVLANCRIKAVFGGLPVPSARLMAEEIFIGKLDPLKIKVSIYQTKFWPKYQRDKVYTHSTSNTSSFGTTTSHSHGTSSATAHGHFYTPGDWFFSSPELTGTSTTDNFGYSHQSGTAASDSFATGASDAVADVPILLPVPFEELSSVQYYTTEEQLTQLTAALKEQFPRHCFLKLHAQETQPLLVPFVPDFFTPQRNRAWYEARCFAAQGALPVAEVDYLLECQERDLVKIVADAESRVAIAPPDNPAVPAAAPSPPKRIPRTKPKKPT